MQTEPQTDLPSGLAAVAAPNAFSAAEETAMRQALDQAQNAWLVGEVPVGAVILRDDARGQPQVLATGYNRPITTNDPTAHAELVALRHAAELVGNYRLPDCTLVVTLEPCAMCAMALMHARFKRVVFGARDPKTGAAGSVVDLFALSQLNHHTDVVGGCLETACGQMLRDFFAERRAEHKARQALRRPAAAAGDAPGQGGHAPAGVNAIPVGDAIETADGDPHDAGVAEDTDILCDEPIPIGVAIEIESTFPDDRGATR